MRDFLNEDIDKLMNEKQTEPEKEDINKVLIRYDRQLLSFEPNIRHRVTWPTPVRKR